MSRQKSYFDRDQKIFTQEQMFAKLEQRVSRVKGSGSSAPARDVDASGGVGDCHTNAGVTPARSQPIELEWGKPQVHNDGGYIMTSCARFTVVKERQNDGSWGYLPFRGKTSLKGYLSSVDEAKAICQQYA